MRQFQFCPRCGQALPTKTERAEGHRQECPACGAAHYQNATPTASALITKDGQVLLARRGVAPYEGAWDIPGGFLLPWEHPEAAVVREVGEETGLVVRPTELLGIFTDTYGDGDEASYTLNLYYVTEIVSGEPRAADDVAELRWFAPNALPPVAFPHQHDVLSRWREAVTSAEEGTPTR